MVEEKYKPQTIPPQKGKPIEKWRHKANGSENDDDKDGRAAGVRKEEIG